MSEAACSSVRAAEAPSNPFAKLLAALKTTTIEEGECHPTLDGETSETPADQSDPCLEEESCPVLDVSAEKIPSDSCRETEAEEQGFPGDVEIFWDHTMSCSESESSGEDSDSESIDAELYDKWVCDSAAAEMYHDNSFLSTGQVDYVIEEFEDADNSYEVDEVATKLMEAAHSGMSSCMSCKTLDEWAHGIETDESRNKIYDKWICDLETWERKRLMYLDERGRIEGFDSSCDKNRTFLVKVDSVEHAKLESQTNQFEAKSIDTVLEGDEHFNTDSPKKNCDNLNKNSTLNVVSNSDEMLEIIDDNEYEPLNLPDDLTCVFEFTNRNLWRKYHNCFKEGKYKNQ